MKSFTYKMSLRIFREEKAFGPGIYELLLNIQETGSLQKAAEKMDMAYSKAWKILKASEEQRGYPLTVRATGGKGGGGSTISPEGERLMERYEGFRNELEEAASEAFVRWFADME